MIRFQFSAGSLPASEEDCEPKKTIIFGGCSAGEINQQCGHQFVCLFCLARRWPAAAINLSYHRRAMRPQVAQPFGATESSRAEQRNHNKVSLSTEPASAGASKHTIVFIWK